MSLSGLGRLDSPTSILDFLDVDSTPFPRSFTRLGFAVLLLDFVAAEFPVSFQSLSCSEPFVSLLNFITTGSPMFMRKFGRAGSGLFASGRSRYGLSLSALDFLHSDFSLLLHSLAQLELSLFVADLAVLDFSLSSKSFGRPDLLLLVLMTVQLGLSMSLRSFA